MENTEKEKPAPLQQVAQALGRSTLVRETIERLKQRGVKVSLSLVYKVIAGDHHRQDVADAFLEVAEEEVARRRQLGERARQLIAEV